MSPSRYAVCLALLTFGCSQASSDPAPRVTAESPGAARSSATDPTTQLQAWIPSGAPAGSAPTPVAPTAAPAAHGEIRGTVRETMNAAGYTYLRMDSGGVDQWVATTAMTVAVGDQVVVGGGDVMRSFHSRTLDRTFETILFAGTVRVAGAAAPTPAAPAPTAPAPAVPAPAVATPGARHGTVRETMNSGGYTYLRVEGDGASTWVAVPETTVAVGDEVDVPPGNEMPGFHSRTLDRTFAQLTFASGVRVVGGAAPRANPAPAAVAPGPLPPGHPPIGRGGLPQGHPSVGAHPSPDGISH